MNLLFANIMDINICQSRHFVFSSVYKKFHPTALFESTILATSDNIVLFKTVEQTLYFRKDMT